VAWLCKFLRLSNRISVGRIARAIESGEDLSGTGAFATQILPARRDYPAHLRTDVAREGSEFQVMPGWQGRDRRARPRALRSSSGSG
jgi:hypothetical protein